MESVNIKEVAKDIIQIEFKRGDSLNSCLKKFYEIMRKHGIKQGTPTCNDEGKEVGVLCDNFEWTMCKELFIKRISDFLIWEMLIGKVPDDIRK